MHFHLFISKKSNTYSSTKMNVRFLFSINYLAKIRLSPFKDSTFHFYGWFDWRESTRILPSVAMLMQCRISRIAFATSLANISFNTGVDYEMHFERRRLHEAFVTMGTFVRPLAAVTISRVNCQPVVVPKRFVAKFAWMSPLPRVVNHVSSQCGFVCE